MEFLVGPPLLSVLQILHIYWFWLIYRMIVKALKSKGWTVVFA